jgi:hypothetical protein
MIFALLLIRQQPSNHTLFTMQSGIPIGIGLCDVARGNIPNDSPEIGHLPDMALNTFQKDLEISTSFVESNLGSSKPK